MSTISETERLFQALHGEVNGVNKTDNSMITCDNCASRITMDNTICDAFDGESCCEECIESYEDSFDDNYDEDEDEDHEIYEKSKPSFTTEEMFKNVSIALGDVPETTNPLNLQIIKGNDYSKQLEELSKRRKKY